MDLKALGEQIVGAHELLALFTKQEIFKISDEEGYRLAVAATNVARHYNLQPNPVVVAWAQLLSVIGAVYGPKIAVIMLARRLAREQKRQAQTFGAEFTRQQAQGYAGAQFTGDMYDSVTVVEPPTGKYKFD